jgi:hypothetical protein
MRMQAEQEPAPEVPSSSIDIAAAKRKARRGQQRDSKQQLNNTLPGRARRKRASGSTVFERQMLCCMIARSVSR